MPKKAAIPTLDALWDLEDEHTAFIGTPSGAKPHPPAQGAKTTVTKNRKSMIKREVASVVHGIDSALKAGKSISVNLYDTFKAAKAGNILNTMVIGGKTVAGEAARQLKLRKLKAAKKAKAKA